MVPSGRDSTAGRTASIAQVFEAGTGTESAIPVGRGRLCDSPGWARTADTLDSGDIDRQLRLIACDLAVLDPAEAPHPCERCEPGDVFSRDALSGASATASTPITAAGARAAVGREFTPQVSPLLHLDRKMAIPLRCPLPLLPVWLVPSSLPHHPRDYRAYLPLAPLVAESGPDGLV